MDDMITNNRKGNPELANLPRKFNIAINATRDDFVHTHINDLAFDAVRDPKDGRVRFNVVVGGYLSIKRCAEVRSLAWPVPHSHRPAAVAPRPTQVAAVVRPPPWP